MKSRMTTLFLCAWLSVITLWLAYMSFEEGPDESAIPSECPGAVVGPSVCRTSLIAVSAAPRSLDGWTLDSRGYLAVDDGILAIYPSREDFLVGDRTTAIRVRGKVDWQDEIASTHAGTYVMFGGTLHSSLAGAGSFRFAGDLTSASISPAIFSNERRSPNGPVKIIDVDDL